MSYDDTPQPPEDIEAERIARAAKLPLNDFGNGQRVGVYHGEDLMFVPRLGWFVWSGHFWEQDEDSLVVRRRAHTIADFIKREAFQIAASDVEEAVLVAAEAARDALEALPDRKDRTEEQILEAKRLEELIKTGLAVERKISGARDRHLRHAKAAGNTGPVGNMLVEAQPYNAARIEDLNQAPLLINTESALLEIFEPAPSGADDGLRIYAVRAREPQREDRITKAMRAPYDPEATCPTFDRFMCDIQPNPAMRDFLARWFGYSMTGLTSEQKLIFCHGTGRNGKSTLVDLIAKIMGDYAASVPIESLTGSEMRKGSDATPDLVRLPGARMVRASEPEEGIRFREALIKALTGGEPILVRRMREEFVEVEPEFKLTISGNHKPTVRGTDDGIWRRLLLVPFDEQIPKDDIDPLLPEKLWAERAGVLNWLLGGALDFLERGLREPDGVLQATEEFREESDPVRTFLTDACEITGDSEAFELTKDLVAAFQLYMREQGGQPWGNQTISKRLREKASVFRVRGQVFTPRKTSSANGYAGIKLTVNWRGKLDSSRDNSSAGSTRGGGSDAPADLPDDMDSFS